MGGWRLKNVAGAVVFSGVIVNWTPFHSSVYPYRISQPSSFRHTVYTFPDGEKVDYFSPSVGSASTYVAVGATRGDRMQNEVQYLRSLDGRHVTRHGVLKVAGKRLPLMRADFDGFTGRSRVEQVSFVSHGYVWRLTASYALRFKSLRPVMLRMLQTFKFTRAPARRAA